LETSEYIDKSVADVNTTPTEAQTIAGNYKKGHVSIKGFQITIENPRGSYRCGKGRNGVWWRSKMKHHYGYFTKTKGHDGDAIDVYIGPKVNSFDYIYVIDQNYADGEFDESKVMFGFGGIKSAIRGYLAHYPKTQERRIRAVTKVNVEDFREWLYSTRGKRKPFSEYCKIKKVAIREMVEKDFIDAGVDFDILDFKRVRSRKTGLMNLVNKATGEVLCKTWYKWVGHMIDGIAIVTNEDDKYNYIDQDGDLISQEWFDDVHEFKNGLGDVIKDMGGVQYYNQIDKEGNLQDDWQEI
jgi:hypothetical protein